MRLAELAVERLGLDELRFVPTAHSPHKARPEGIGAVAGETRARLLEVLLRGSPGPFRVERLEIERGGVSYTADTLDALRQREPDASWILILGGDQLPEFEHWRSFGRIMAMASAAFSPRPGHEMQVPEGLVSRVRASWTGGPGGLVLLPSTELDLASTHLRRDLQEKGTTEGIPPEVLAAIQGENLYR